MGCFGISNHEKIAGRMINDYREVEVQLNNINAIERAVSGYKAQIDDNLGTFGLAAANLGQEFLNSMKSIQECHQKIQTCRGNVEDMQTSCANLISQYELPPKSRIDKRSGNSLSSESSTKRTLAIASSCKALTNQNAATTELTKALTGIKRHVENQLQKTREDLAVMRALVPVGEYTLDPATEQRRLDQNYRDRFLSKLGL